MPLRPSENEQRSDSAGVGSARAGTIALLRAVGHALVNDDAKKDDRLEKAQRAWWDKLRATKPNPSIFWDFIERDRNLLLHEAELTVGHSAEVFIGGPPPPALQEPPQPEQPPPPPSAIYSGPLAADPRAFLVDPSAPPQRAIYTFIK